MLQPLPESLLAYLPSTSLGASITGTKFDVRHFRHYSLQLVWTGGTAAGTIKLQASNDGTNYEDIPGYSKVIAGAGSVLFDVPNRSWTYCRAVFTRTSGTGDITVFKLQGVML